MIGLVFKQLFEQSPNAYMVLDRELRYVAANAAYQRETATRLEALLGREFFEVFPHDPADPNNASLLLVRRSLERALATGEPDVLASVVYTIPTRTERGVELRERVWSATHTPLRNDAGEVLYVLQHTVDITAVSELRARPDSPAGDGVAGDRVAADVLRRADAVQRTNTLLEGERSDLRRLFDQSPGFVCFLRGSEHVFDLVNPAYLQLIGHRDVIGKPVREALSDLTGQGYFELLDQVFATGEPYSARGMQVVLQRQVGAMPELRFVDFVFQPIIDVDGTSLGIFVSGNDVTAERQAIADRERLALERSFLAEFLPVQVWTSDPLGALSYVSQNAAEYFGLSAERIIGEGWKGVVHPEDLPLVVERWGHSLRTGEPYEVEFRLRRGVDGAYRWHLGRALALRGADGAIVKWYGSNSDIDDQRQALIEREQLITALRSKNGELDRFAYIASHDLKAPLRGLVNLSEWILEDLADTASPKTREHLTMLGARATAMSELVDNVLRYARSGLVGNEVREVDTAQLLRDVVEMLAPSDGAQVVLGAFLPTVRAPATALSQVFMNLIGNALRHGKREGARVYVDAKPYAAGHRFEVRDDGPGVAADQRDKIWELFRTGRASTSGSGIGLSIVKRTVEAHGGVVEVSETPGGGATFSFTWPDKPAR